MGGGGDQGGGVVGDSRWYGSRDKRWWGQGSGVQDGDKGVGVHGVKGWGGGGQGDGVVWFLLQPPHPTTHTPLLPSPLDPYPLTLPPWINFY